MTGKQEQVPVPKQKLPNPSDYTCEWCGETATVLHQRRHGRKFLPTQQYVFTCREHAEQGRKAVAKPERQYKD